MRYRSDVRIVGDLRDVIDEAEPTAPLVWERSNARGDAAVEVRPAAVFITVPTNGEWDDDMWGEW
jgi:hypothetical protein